MTRADFEEVKKNILYPVIGACVIGIGAAAAVTWANTNRAIERVDALETQQDAQDERLRKMSDRISEIGTDVRWLRSTIEGVAPSPR